MPNWRSLNGKGISDAIRSTGGGGTRPSGRHVGRQITAAFEFLATTPGAGHARPDLTSEPVKFWQVFSYLIVHDPAMRPLGIARVLHSSRDLKTLLRENPPHA